MTDRPAGPELSVNDVFVDLVRHPVRHLIYRWNWKSALTSSLIRGAIFFAANLTAGLSAALSALGFEFLFRTATSGFYGSLTQAFRRAHPVWLATLCVMVLLPVFSHGLEFLLHWLRGTPELKRSILASTSFTLISTLFNFYVMRHNVLVVGERGEQSLWQDVRRMPALVASFLALLPLAVWRLLRFSMRAGK